MRQAETAEAEISGEPPEPDAAVSPLAEGGEPAAETPAPVPDAPEDWEAEDDPEAAKRRYLLGRFWHSARAFWSRGGDRLAWPLSGRCWRSFSSIWDSSTASMSGIAASSMRWRSAIPQPSCFSRQSSCRSRVPASAAASPTSMAA